MCELHQINGWNISHKLQKRSLLTVINIVAGLSIFFFGYDQGLMGGVNNAKHYIDLMGFGYTEDRGDDKNVPVITKSLLQGGIVASYYLGAVFGAFWGGWIGDKTGRIKTIAFGAAWTCIGAALQTAAMNPTWMICCEKKTNDKEPKCQLTKASSSIQRHRHGHLEHNRTCLGHRNRRTHFPWPVHSHPVHPEYLWRSRGILACIVSISWYFLQYLLIANIPAELHLPTAVSARFDGDSLWPSRSSLFYSSSHWCGSALNHPDGLTRSAGKKKPFMS